MNTGKKKFMIVMAIIWGIIAIIFYISSIQEVYGIQIANIQATTFCAGSAILCGINIIGALIVECMEELHSSINVATNTITRRLDSNPSGTETSGHIPSKVSNSKPSYLSTTYVDKKTATWICKKCGSHNSADARSCKDCGTYR